MKEKTFKGFIAKSTDPEAMTLWDLPGLLDDFTTEEGTASDWYPTEWPPKRCKIIIKWEE